MDIQLRNWENPASQERLEMVFTNRNQQYGAYKIRKGYDKNILTAFMVTCIAGILLVGAPLIRKYFQTPTIEPLTINRDVVLQIENFVETKKTEPIPPSQTPMPPQKASGTTQQFTVPLIVDSLTDKETPPQEILLKTNIGAKPSKSDTLLANVELPKSNNEKVTNEVFMHVEEMPQFPGGEEAMIRFIGAHLQYPQSARETNIMGVVYLSFIINKNGEVDQPEIKRGIGGGCEEEALRVLSTMPRWKPGKQNGEAVNVQYLLPLKFSLK
jgi:periplasmic protein TonB